MPSSLKALLAASLISAAPLAPAFSADTYALDPAHTQAIFNIDHLGFSTITGAVHGLKGTLMFDPAKPETSTIGDDVAVTINFEGIKQEAAPQGDARSKDESHGQYQR